MKHEIGIIKELIELDHENYRVLHIDHVEEVKRILSIESDYEQFVILAIQDIDTLAIKEVWGFNGLPYTNKEAELIYLNEDLKDYSGHKCENCKLNINGCKQAMPYIELDNSLINDCPFFKFKDEVLN